jgi:NAD(P)-dependent dehydrogenase (short-subunit alcohol dehydrogenase family)
MSETGKPIALVTGASRGLGREVALEAVRAGFDVIAIGRAQKALESLDDEIRGIGGAATLVPLDLKDMEGIDRLGGAIFERWGRLDAFVSCAGVLGVLTGVHELPPRTFDEVVAVDLTANWRMIRSFDPLLRLAPAGRAVFVTSRASEAPRAWWSAYGATKAALDYMVGSYAAEVATSEIKVNLVDPGPMRTAMRLKAFPHEDQDSLPSPEAAARVVVSLMAASEQRHGERILVRPRDQAPGS